MRAGHKGTWSNHKLTARVLFQGSKISVIWYPSTTSSNNSNHEHDSGLPIERQAFSSQVNVADTNISSVRTGYRSVRDSQSQVCQLCKRMTSALQVAIRRQVQKHGGNNEFLGELAGKDHLVISTLIMAKDLGDFPAWFHYQRGWENLLGFQDPTMPPPWTLTRAGKPPSGVQQPCHYHAITMPSRLSTHVWSYQSSLNCHPQTFPIRLWWKRDKHHFGIVHVFFRVPGVLWKLSNPKNHVSYENCRLGVKSPIARYAQISISSWSCVPYFFLIPY